MSGKATAIITTENTTKYYLGIDLGGTGIKCGVVDENGKILVGGSCPTRKGVTPEDVLADMATLARSLIGKAGVKIDGAGVGCPGTIDTENGVIRTISAGKTFRSPST